MSRAVTAIDTNLLVYALNASAPEHDRARAWLRERQGDVDLVVSELVLVELYVLVRNPAVFPRPLSADRAADVVAAFRRHPAWRLVDHDPSVMDQVWRIASTPGFARTRIFDVRFGLGLLRHGVTHLATRNVAHFERLGFAAVFDPLA